MQQIEIFTDGSSLGNPGPGGWAAVLRCNGRALNLSGFEKATTNNRMEATAVCEALSQLKRPCRITLTSDSKYVLGAIGEWIPNWEKKNFKKVKNVDLMRRLAKLIKGHEIECVWVKGHNDHPENELCDVMARTAAENQQGIKEYA